MFKKLFKRRRNKLPSKDGLYIISWGEESGWGIRYFSFTGNYYDILDQICILQTKGNITELNIEKFDRNRLSQDGHWHVVEGVPQYHSWEDCPENYPGIMHYHDGSKGYSLYKR